jgi:uncharacterized protein (TIGR00369 family)
VRTLGISAGTFRQDEVVLSLDWTPTLCTSKNVLHGGIVVNLMDLAAGVCAFLNLPGGAAGTATVEAKTNFLVPTRRGTVRALSRPLRVDSRISMLETEVRGDDGKLAPNR